MNSEASKSPFPVSTCRDVETGMVALVNCTLCFIESSISS